MESPSRPVVLVTMGGRGFRFKQAGYSEPKPFVNVLGKPMIKRVLDLFPKSWPTVCVVNNEDYSEKHFSFIKSERSDVQFTSIAVNNGGPMKTVIAGLELIPDHQPVFVTYCDYGQVWDAEDFLNFVRKNDSDMCFVGYRGFHAHYLTANMYCYAKTEGHIISDIKEKESFSKNREDDFASTGGYYFKSAKLLKEAIIEQQKQNLSWNGEYFTSLAAKALMNVRSDLKVHAYEINKFFQWGTPEDLKAFEYWAEVKYEIFQ
ncbi:MAG: NTP transferase domain-containing protein [Pseudobdellovibrio sp.]|nr:NTP transferase domain-containing protein [Pseudobdellovibrio sp.]